MKLYHVEYPVAIFFYKTDMDLIKKRNYNTVKRGGNMMKKDKTKNIASCLCALLNIVLVTIAVIGFFTKGGVGNMSVHGTVCFRYFTIDSNILCALMCIPVLICGMKSLNVEGYEVPEWVLSGKHMGTSAVTLTFLVVMLYLGPTAGYGFMFAGSNLYLHLFCPLLAILSYIFSEPDRREVKRGALLGTLPTFIYAVIYLIMVIFIGESNGGWEDFYTFNRGGLWPVFFTVMVAATYGIAVALRKLNRRFAGR